MLAWLSYSATGLIVDITSKEIFSSAAKEISLEVRSTYQPMISNTVLLSNTNLPNTFDYNSRMKSFRLLIGVLQTSPEATSIFAGYGNGDHFMVRKLATDSLKLALKSPKEAVFAVDHNYGDRRQVAVRYFYDEDLNQIAELGMPDSNYDPRIRPWYVSAMKSDGVITTAPYVFFSSQQVGITIAKKAASGNAVVATDVTLDRVSQYLASKRITANTQILLRGSSGILAWSDNNPLVMDKGKLRQKRIAEVQLPLYRALASNDIAEGWLIHREHIQLLDNGDVELLIAVPETEFLSGLANIRTRFLTYSFGFLLLLVPIAWLLANQISKPIRDLHSSIVNFDRTTFELELPRVRAHDEVGALNNALRSLSDSLGQYISDLARESAARQKYESELDIARTIQMDLVPGEGFFESEICNDQIFACLYPAKAVGGDLFEVLELHDGRYFLAVGDVSDKGMPAALFMARSVALMKMLAPRASSAGHLLSQLNNELVKGNDSCMFITLFCCFYDSTAGELQFSNAGHNPPICINRGTADFIVTESSSALGVFDDQIFDDHNVTMTTGDVLISYTDGITEAFDEKKEEFSDLRLINAVKNFNLEASASEYGKMILEEVERFVSGAAQSDDITLMVLKKL